MSWFLPRFLIFLTAAFAVLFFGLRSLEHRMTFHPTRISADRWQRPPACQEVWLTPATGNRIHGCYLASAVIPAAGSIVHAHGNGGDILSVFWVSERLAAKGFNVLLFDYEGYGRSEGDLPGEAGLYADGDAAYRYLIDQRHADPGKIILYGHSLGSTVATDVASRNPCGALVVESGLSSASDHATYTLPWLPEWLHWIGRNRFESVRKIADVQCPVMVIHGTADRTISFEQGRKLFAAAREPKRFLEIPGGSHWLPRRNDGAHLDEIAHFLHSSLAR